MTEVIFNGITYKDEQIIEEIVLTKADLETLTEKLKVLEGASND